MLNSDSRKKNSIRNAVFSIFCQIITVVSTFITRTIFIKYLGSSYLGISGLFTNILSILSVMDLGFDTAIIYSMYKPIKEKNEKKISQLMYFYKKVYFIIGIIVAIIGFSLLPFLDNFINLSNPIKYIKIYYILYLMDTVGSYFLVNRVAIINADQKMYIIKKYTMVFKIIQSIIQIICLILFRNFISYLIIQILFTFLINLYGAIKAKKMYPFISKNSGELPKKEKKIIFDNVKSMFIYKIGGVILNNTDNILISTLVSTEMVGIYGNYYMLINSVNNMVILIFSSMLASVGNLNAQADLDKSEKVLYNIDFLAVIVYGFCSICLFVLSGDFIKLMWGGEYVTSILIPLAAVVNFCIVGFLHPLRLYRETTGVFKEIKYIFIWTSILNIIFSILLGKFFSTPELKLFGIIIATALARVLTTVWFEPKKIFETYFHKSSKKYFFNKFKSFLVLLLNIFVTYYISNIIVVTNWISFALKICACCITSICIYFIFYRKNDSYMYYKKLIFSFFNRSKIEKRL